MSKFKVGDLVRRRKVWHSKNMQDNPIGVIYYVDQKLGGWYCGVTFIGKGSFVIKQNDLLGVS